MARQVLYLLLLLLIPFASVAAQDGVCPERTYSFPFAVDEIVQVTEGAGNRLRASPSASAEIITVLPGGTRIMITGSSQCGEGYYWWPVTVDGQSGWTVQGADGEPFLLKVRQETPEPPAEGNRDLPMIDTANQIEMWGDGSPVMRVLSADGETLAVATTTGILLYKSQTEPVFLPPQSGRYTGIVFNPANVHQLLATDTAGGLWLWEISTQEVTLFNAVEGSANKPAFSADGKTIFATTNDWLYVWDATTGERKHSLFINYNRETSTTFSAISDDGTKVAVSEYAYPVQIWDISGSEAVLTERVAKSEWFEPLRFTANNTLLIGADNQMTFMWEWERNDMRRIADEIATPVPDFDYGTEIPVYPRYLTLAASDVSLAYSSSENEIIVHDMNTGEVMDVLTYPVDQATALVMSADGQQIAVCGSDGPISFDPVIHRFDLRESRESFLWFDYREENTYFGCLWMVYDEQRHDVVIDNSQPSGGYRIGEHKQLFQFPDDVYSSGDNAVLAGDTIWLTGSQIGVYKADLNTGELDQMVEPTLVRENYSGYYLKSLSDLHENHLAYVGGVNAKTLYIYDIVAEEAVFSFDVENAVTSLAFSPDGSIIVTGDDAGRILKWDAATGEALGQIGRVSDIVWTVLFSPDSTRLYSNGLDEVVRVWSLE